MTTQRRVIPIRDAFFCDGAWYVLSSNSLGGGGLSGDQVAEKLQSEDPEPIRQLLSDGVCMPLYFPGDCALDNAVIVEGELDEEEEAEWIARLRSKLEVPCGEFMVMGGGLDDDFEIAMANPEAPDPHFVFFQKVVLEPGTCLVEVFAFLSSLTVNMEWEDQSEDAEPFDAYWARTRGDEPPPEWIEFVEEEEYPDSEEFEFLE
jgi:hypothetical protein